jgi:hypothetical protein
MFFDDNCVAFKREVTFMRREEKREQSGLHPNSMAEGNLTKIAILFLVWEHEFTKAKEGMKAR